MERLFLYFKILFLIVVTIIPTQKEITSKQAEYKVCSNKLQNIADDFKIHSVKGIK